MYQTIGEKIVVAGVYKGGKFYPRKFQWQKHSFPIHEIYSVYDWKDGVVRKRKFSVMVGRNVYLIEFDRDQETWTLDQIWVEQ